MKSASLPILVLSVLTVSSKAAFGATLLEEALASFPPQVIRVEYSSPAKLRRLPNYANLRQRYLGGPLVKLEASLAELGVVENDVDQLIVGWRAASAGPDLFGLATGRFDTSKMAEGVKARGLKPEKLSGETVYCLEAGLAASCVVVFDPSFGAFGTFGTLSSLLDARRKLAPALASSDRWVRLLKSAKTDAPIWGAAVGDEVGEWFKGWMPGQGTVQLDWSRVFQKVEALSYSVDTPERQKVSLDLKLDCTSAEAAASMRQILDGLRLAQQLAWQAQNPNQPNPYEAIGVQVADRQVALKLTAEYASLQTVGPLGAP